MIGEKDIVIFDEYTRIFDGAEVIYHRAYLVKDKASSIMIFGQRPFGEEERDIEDLDFELAFPKALDTINLLTSLNLYLDFLSDCKKILVKACEQNMPEIEITDDWYEALEIYHGSIFVDINGISSGSFSCGDNVITNHLLEIHFDHKEISEMHFVG